MANLGWSPLRSAGADQKGTTGQEFCRNAQAEVDPRRFAWRFSGLCPSRGRVAISILRQPTSEQGRESLRHSAFSKPRLDTLETDVFLTP